VIYAITCKRLLFDVIGTFRRCPLGHRILTVYFDMIITDLEEKNIIYSFNLLTFLFIFNFTI